MHDLIDELNDLLDPVYDMRQRHGFSIEFEPAETRRFTRRRGEALHPAREPLDTLDRLRRTIGEYNFAGQYQQSPAPLQPRHEEAHTAPEAPVCRT